LSDNLRSTLIIFLIALQSASGQAQSFSVNEKHQRAYAFLLNLEFEKANVLINELRAANKQDIGPIYLEDLSDFLFIVVTEDRAQFELRKTKMADRLKQIGKLPDSSPYKLLSVGEIHLHWAFSMMRFGEYLSGAREINKAFHALESNTKKFPDFLATYKSMGLLHTLIGTVPDNYKWATKLMGVDGTIEQGIAEMELVIKRSEGKTELKNLRKETLFLVSFLHINLLNDASALRKIEQKLQSETGPLMDFSKASLMSEMGRTNNAIDLIQNSTKTNSGFPYLNYLLGEMKLARMDADADKPLLKYVNSFKGNSYLKAAYQKLAWHALLVQKSPEKYSSYMKQVEAVGSTMLDEDKIAQKEFESGVIPNRVLLMARLQFDGGFLQQSLSTLISSKSSELTTEDDRLEFTYRLGRIHDEMGNEKEAVSYYMMTIKNGADSKRYFAANSSLMLGKLYEKQGEKAKAIKAFEACFNFNNSEYKNSIGQKAKAGILRLKG
jgi:tetratricopeptide (TPR) repeat protein